MICEYFTRYGNEGRGGACANTATLELTDGKLRRVSEGGSPICVCFVHARTIVLRFPTLGSVFERFESLK